MKDVRVEGIQADDQYKSPKLIVSVNDPLDNSRVELSLTLWSTSPETQDYDKKTIENTERLLRIATENEQVTFDGKAEGDGTHISNWVEHNKGVVLNEIYRNDKGYLQITENNGATSALGGSKYLKTEKDLSQYVHGENVTYVREAMSLDMQRAINAKDTSHPNVYKTRNGKLKYQLEGVIYDVIITQTNKFESEHEEGTFKGLLDNLISTYNDSITPNGDELTRDELVAFRESLDTDEKKSYQDFVLEIGGMNAPRLPDMVGRMFKSLSDSITKYGVAFYVFVPETGLTFRTTILKAPNKMFPNLQSKFIEFMSDEELTPNDLHYFVRSLVVDEDSQINALETVLDSNLSNLNHPEKLNQPDKTTVLLEFLRKLLVGHSIKVSAQIGTLEHLGSYIGEIGMRVSSAEDIEDYVSNFLTNNAQTTVSPVENITDDDLPFGNNEEVKVTPAENSNPFATDQITTNDNPFSTEKKEPPSNDNPFANNNDSDKNEPPKNPFADSGMNPFAP